MEKRRRRKHLAHKRVLVVCHEHRAYLETTPGGSSTVAGLDRAVAEESAQIAEHDRCRTEGEAASARCERGRRTLHNGVKHVALVGSIVKPDNGEFPPLDASAVKTDEELIARVENVHRVASAHAELFVEKGVQPGFLDGLWNELAAFKKAKEAVTLVGKRYTEANERFDHALDDGDVAVGILENILSTSPNAPVGALTALQHAKLIGPRVEDDDESAPSTPNQAPPAAEPPAHDKVA